MKRQDYEMPLLKKAIELARERWIKQSKTITNNRTKYVWFRFIDWITKHNWTTWRGKRYIEIDELRNIIPEKIILKRAKEIENK